MSRSSSPSRSCWAAAFSAVVAGSDYALALVVAVKALGRYPELRTAKHGAVSERFIIGTFASLLWAGLWAGAAYWGVRAW